MIRKYVLYVEVYSQNGDVIIEDENVIKDEDLLYISEHMLRELYYRKYENVQEST